MRIIADLHIHSRYSRATSSSLTLPRLERWARLKGLDLVGTGDCTHPAWLEEMRENLEPAEEGLFRLKEGARRDFDAGEGLAEPSASSPPPRFIVTGEISTIYSRDGKTRKIHHLVILPSLDAAAAFQAGLESIGGNVRSDGRPILGLDSRDLFARLLEADDRAILVPAHVWTPWFSALGARSGFDSIDECYGDLASRIGAIETGLSSNPPMNWALSSLDRFAIVSNSDAHSPAKLGREATIFDAEPSYRAIAEALGGGGPKGRVAGTVEFFPQEGKYHYEGHRACGVALSPGESAAAGGICPACGKRLTPGVLGRVAELADRPIDEFEPCPPDTSGTNRRPYHSLIPLPEILAELVGVGAASKKVSAAYGALIAVAGSELSLLMDRDLKELETLGCPGLSGELLAEAVGRMRSGKVSIKPGYDGEYGSIRVFAPGERIEAKAERELFGATEASGDGAAPPKGAPPKPTAKGVHPATAAKKSSAPPGTPAIRLDAAQERALGHPGGPALVVAGPGTGKTTLLALRVARLVDGSGSPPGDEPGSRPRLAPSSILALTFTNKAAGELKERIAKAIGAERASRLTAKTFHSFCLSLLREESVEIGIPPDFVVLDEDERLAVLEALAGRGKAKRLGAYAEERKRYLLLPGDTEPRLGPGAPEGLVALARELGLPDPDPELEVGYSAYREELKARGVLDFDDLVAGAARLLASKPGPLEKLRARFKAFFVDEYQDLNFAQYALVRILVPSPMGRAGEPELFAIGDPDQAIYGFRGSDRRLIDRFLVDYPTAATYRLERSFRCAAPIIGAADRIVGRDLEGSGAAVALSRTSYPTDKAEAEGIAREIDRLIGGTRFFAIDSGIADAQADGLKSLAECAVLVRAAALATPIEKALNDHGLPYRLIGEKPWWEEEPAATIVRRLRESRRRQGRRSSPAEAVRAEIVDISMEHFKKSPGPDAFEDCARRLVALASRFVSMDEFLDGLSLGSPQDGYEARSERLSVMTIHASKGLEFDHVFVAGLEEGILPFTLYGDCDPEEERRLLYVAMTRARIGLHLSWAKARLFRGRELALPPSRFLSAIEELVPLSEAGPRKPRDPQLGLF